jgi:hypothetical protein
MNGQYHFGTPTFEEWAGLWKCDESDSDITDEEFHAAYTSLDQLLSRYGKVGFKAGCDFYVLGDSYGDKTQDIEIVDPNALTVELIDGLQQWIRHFFPSWRVVIPTNTEPKALIVVYKDVIRFPNEYEESDKEGLAKLREGMFSLDAYQHLRK